MRTRRASSAPALDAPQSWIAGHYPAFDGLRGIAFLMVFAIHYCTAAWDWQNKPPLWAGVDLFFVLSGFLITGIIADTHRRPNFFRNFYGRRALRILPLFACLWLVILLLTPVLHLIYSHYVFTEAIFIGNFFVPASLLDLHRSVTVLDIGRTHLSIHIGALWTLCVEEQYYLVWPLVMTLLPSRKWLMRLCVAGTVGTLLLRCGLLYYCSPAMLSTKFLYYSTYTRCDSLLIGSFVALWLREHHLRQSTLHRIAVLLIAVSTTLIMAGLLLTHGQWVLSEAHPIFASYGYTLIAFIAVGVLLLSLDPETRLHRAVRHPWLAHIGSLSFGLYLVHDLPELSLRYFAQTTLRPHHLAWTVFPIAFAFSYGVARLSYRLIEAPCLRLKVWFAYDRVEAPAFSQVSPLQEFKPRTQTA